MATIKEYYYIDSGKYLSQEGTWKIQNTDSAVDCSIVTRILYAFDANAKFWSIYIGDEVEVKDIPYVIFVLLTAPNLKECSLPSESDSTDIREGYSDYSEFASSKSLQFTGRVFLYIDKDLSIELRNHIKTFGLENGFHTYVKDREYALKLSQREKPLAFISHDSRDKDSIVRLLVAELIQLNCPVWYDEYSLNVGDSLRESIEKGLKETKKCIVVLSPNFLSNEGWGKAEFNSIYAREIMEKNNVILPVWHNVDADSVYQYSPRLLDKFGLNTAIGVKELAKKLAIVIRGA